MKRKGQVKAAPKKRSKRARVVEDNDKSSSSPEPNLLGTTANGGDDDDESGCELEDVTEERKKARASAVEKISECFKDIVKNGTHRMCPEKDVARRKSSIYAFFNAEPEIEFKKDGISPDYLVFRCSQCATKVKQGINTSDKGSTGNLSVHAKKCWGDDAVNAAKESTLDKARAAVKTFGKKSQGKLTAALKTTKGWAKTFATRPPEKEQIRVVTARWVAENARPFRMVQDRSYRWLQKEGRPSHYVPSKETVARDVKKLYRLTKAKLAEELQVSWAISQ
ncbi:hypothetical protein EV361DRAFT_551238 [Lentinula raphanica]|nr:hypothetical protein EV361DRAFT_551238 [Lentinula raphanica]